MFTFSFSAALADTTYTAADVVAAMQAEADDYCKLIDAQGTAFVKNYDATKGYDKAAVQEAANEVVAEKKADFLADVIKLQAAIKGDYTATEKANEVAKVKTAYESKYNAIFTTEPTDLISAKAFNLAKANAVAEIAKIDTTKYNASTADEDLLVLTEDQAKRTLTLKAGDKVSKKAYVEAVVAYINDYVNSLEAAKKAAENNKLIADLAYKMAVVKAVIEPIPTLETEAENAKTDEELKAYKTSIMEGELALAEAKVRKVLNDELATLKKATKVNTEAVAKVEKELADLDAQYDAAKEVLTAYIAAGNDVKTGHLECTTYAGFAAVKAELEKCVDRVADVAQFEAYAKVIANVTDASGAKIYDSEEVAKITKKVTEQIYLGSTTYARAANVDTFKDAKVAGAASLAQKKVAVDDVKNYKNADNYDEAQAAELKAIVDKAVEDIMAAATKADIDEVVKAAKADLDKVIDKSTHAKDWLTTGKLGKEFASKYEKELLGYAAYAYAKLPEKGYEQAKAALAGQNGNVTAIPTFAMNIVKEAYTVEEIPAKVAEAKAAIDALKSDAEIKAAAEAVEAAIAQIKVPVTADQKDNILATKKAYDEYKKINGATTTVKNEALLNAAVSTLASIEKAELVKKFNACPADADAIAALKAEIEAYNDYATDKYNPDFTKLEAQVKAAKFDAVRAAMVAIPAEPTVADRAVIEAARKAYDALTLEEKVEFGADKLNALYLDKLTSAEATLAATEISAVEALKIKASSSAKKGSITVKWTVKGDKAAADGFQVWKSTKAQKGYKKAITTKKTSFKNTKNLKKGVRYFYKVRAYKVVDGKTYYSDWSNKANRYAK